MIMIRDGTGRFPERPHWELGELEQLCEKAITEFLIKRYGFERIAVPTEALTELIECYAAPLEIGRNLSDNQYEVLGYTQFEPGKKPCVKIATELWQKWYQANRLRFTLAHEFGHILLHRWLYDKYPPVGGPQLCYRHNLLPSDLVLDWMEWQAGYAAGALLMPESFVRRAVAAFFCNRAEKPPIKKDAVTAPTLSGRIALTFEVSEEAANVRLAKLGYLID